MRVFPFVGSTAPRLAFEKSYSALIFFNLLTCSTARRNETDVLAADGVYDDQNIARNSRAHSNEPLLGICVWIRAVQGERVVENSLSICEGDTVLLEITGCLRGIVLESHALEYAQYAYLSTQTTDAELNGADWRPG